MAYIEFPKHVYKDGDVEKESALVKNAEEERLAGLKGYAALPSNIPEEGSIEALQASPTYLEFPKHVYKGEGEARESIIVKNAEEEAAAAEKGYAPVSAPAANEAPVDDVPVDDTKRKPGRPAKAK